MRTSRPVATEPLQRTRTPLVLISLVAALVAIAGAWMLWSERRSDDVEAQAPAVPEELSAAASSGSAPAVATPDALSIERDLLNLERQLPPTPETASPLPADVAPATPAAAESEPARAAPSRSVEKPTEQPARAAGRSEPAPPTEGTRPEAPRSSNSANDRHAPRESHAQHGEVDISGTWHLATRIQSSSYRPYRGLRLGFRVDLTQEGNRVTGRGQKWTENGRGLPAAARTPITLEGTVENGRSELTFVENGSARASQGTLVLEVTESGELRGTFRSDAAASRGAAYARRAR